MFVFRDGCRFLRTKPDLLAALFALTSDPSIAIVKDCYYIFVNLSADETLHQVISELLITQLTNKNKTQTTVRLIDVLDLVPIKSNILQVSVFVSVSFRFWWQMSKFFQCS